ncbi:sugar phosphorylase [Pseudalkalibacillus sp. A8]|uniref:sugar phosphorylase n=1 Tax=Pseudalkalibacillus sp. A8 TaxID=3382641 RepID=UPI0038B4EA69
METIKKRLEFIYEDQDIIDPVWTEIKKRIHEIKKKPIRQRKQKWDEKDIVLITYGDQVKEEEIPALKTFKNMYDRFLAKNFEIVHILPFYPYSSDDGFSVIDYKKVNPTIGEWKEVKDLSKSARLMFDYVCNHISSQSDWFQNYLEGNPHYKDYFIELDPSVDLSTVTRPRAYPLLTKFKLLNGEERYVWTTFSEDQIDLNFSNPQVLLEMLDVLLFYIEEGAEYIRLDAVGFIWKEIGTTCIHHEKAHELVKLFRDVVDEVANGTVVITETNVPHKDNISYFGNGHDEAHMVYQFPLPPLVLYSIMRENGKVLTDWAKTLHDTSQDTTYFNFLASHDGIGMNPIRGIIPEEEILSMVKDLQEEVALVSYKRNPDGSESPYEINVTYLDALNKKTDNDDLRVKRFIVAHSILLTLPGVPAVYIQSILGSRNDYKGVSRTGMNRSINRQKYKLEELEEDLLNQGTLRHKVYNQLSDMISVRKEEKLFHPNIAMEVMDLGEAFFAFDRFNKYGEKLTVIHNLKNEEVECSITGKFINVLTQNKIEIDDSIVIGPYQFLWLKPIN